MNETELEHFRDVLDCALARLDQDDALGRTAQQVVPLDQQAVGRLSRMGALQDQAMAKATQRLRDQERKRLLAARARINSGEFGYCVDCGDDIATERLERAPTAPKCLSCTRG
jgi:RNA polymerase-binding transcription factor